MVTDNTLEINLDTWIISDTHFFHENIGRYCNRPENWQELIIKNWNDLVSPDETVLHLGDFALGNKSNFDLLAGMLNRRLVLIQGNHDRISKSYCETRSVILIKNSLNVEISDQMKLIFSVNMSVEVREYRPWRLGDILKSIKDHPTENEVSLR